MTRRPPLPAVSISIGLFCWWEGVYDSLLSSSVCLLQCIVVVVLDVAVAMLFDAKKCLSGNQ